MTEYPIDTLIVEAVQSMFFQRIINFQPQPLRTTFDPGTIDQHIQNRKQHDTGEIRDHQSYRNGKSLIVKDSTRDTTHKYQRYKYGDCRKRRTQHRSHHLTCSRHAGSPQRITLFPVLRYIFRYDNRTVDHHTQCQDQSGQGDDIERHFTQVEKQETDDNRHHHTQPNNEWRFDISQEEYGNDTNENKTE